MIDRRGQPPAGAGAGDRPGMQWVGAKGGLKMKIARSLTTALCAGLLSLAAYGGARAADEGVTIDAIKKAGVLRIGTWLQYQPEMYKDLKTGEIKGFWIEMARKMATDLGVKLEIVDSDWDGLIPGLQGGKL